MRNTIRARAGLSLIEISIAIAIFGTIASIAGESLISGTRMSEEIAVSTSVNDDTNRVLHRVATQLRSADYSWIYMNQGEVSTYTFKVCTGLGVNPAGEIGPQFDNTYTIAFDSVAGVLTATLAEQSTGRLISQEIARDLRIPDGFRVNQLGTEVLVKGNQLQLAMARTGHLADGTEVTREASTTIFLRSTIYANTNLTTTSTPNSELPADPDAPADSAAAPVILLGDDSNTATKVGSVKNVNALLITGSVQMPAGATDTINFNTFDLRMNKPSDGVDALVSLRRGWISGENKNNALNSNEFAIEGWVRGSLTVTTAVSSLGGADGLATRTY